MLKRLLIMLSAVAVCAILIIGFKVFVHHMIGTYMASMGAQKQTISTTKAAAEDWQPDIKAVGTLRAVNGADMSSEEAGIVESINFESGSDVEKNAVLVQLRAEDDIAKLKSLMAAEKLAEIMISRDMKQVKAQAISQAVVDNDAAALDEAKAQVGQQQAVVDKKTVRAPFAGHVGIRQIDLGQYLTSGAAIVTLQQLDPIFLDFTVPEQSLPQLGIGGKISATTDAMPGQTFTGEVTAINSRIDEATRNIQVRAAFKNPDHKLLPGMFASVTLDVGKPVSYITLPETAIAYNPYGDTVFIVDETDPNNLIAKQTFVTVGSTRGDQIAVLTGVKDGETVVTSGQIKLRNNAAVTVNNEIQPTNDPNPKPVDR